MKIERLKRAIDKISGSPQKEIENVNKGLKGRIFEVVGGKIDPDDKIWKISNKRLVLITSLTVLFAVAVFYGFTTWSVGYTSDLKFCLSCHEMERAYRGWKNSSHYINQAGVVATCADCHLPTDMISKVKVKIARGIKDTVMHYFSSADFSQTKFSEKARRGIGDDSCVQCHRSFPSFISKGGLIAHLAVEKGERKRCVECHKNFAHQNIEGGEVWEEVP